MSEHSGWRTMRLMFLAAGLLILCFHFYYYCYFAFREWKLTSPVANRFLAQAIRAGLFRTRQKSLLVAMGLVLVSCIGTKSNPSRQSWKTMLPVGLLGILFSLSGFWSLRLSPPMRTQAMVYMGITSLGLILLHFAASFFGSQLAGRFSIGVFNDFNETFPQEERLLTNPFSVNLKGRYMLKGQERKMFINLTSIFRGVMVVGQSSAGKSFFVIRQIIEQHLEKGFSMFVYDFKYDDLATLTWNLYRKAERRMAPRRTFHLIAFDDLSRSERCNPLHPDDLEDISDAMEISRTLLLALNRTWIGKQGDFFVDSAVILVASAMWWLKKQDGGRYCSLPHVIELLALDYMKLFTVLRAEIEIRPLIAPFVSAFENGAKEQLEGQVASARTALAGLSSPKLYYILSGNDFSLDINNAEAPKVVCIGSCPAKDHVHGAVASIIASRMHKMINKRDSNPCTLIYDEAPTVYLPGLDMLLATGRSNKICVVLGIQSIEQLRKGYGQIMGDLIFGLPGNLFCGQVSGDTAKIVSDRFSPILQDRQTVSTHSHTVSTTDSKQLTKAIHPGKIATLSSGEFVGVVSDEATEPKRLKVFHAKIVVDYKKVERSESEVEELPVRGEVTKEMLNECFMRIKREVEVVVNERIGEMIT